MTKPRKNQGLSALFVLGGPFSGSGLGAGLLGRKRSKDIVLPSSPLFEPAEVAKAKAKQAKKRARNQVLVAKGAMKAKEEKKP